MIDDDLYEISNIQVWFDHDFVEDLNSFDKKDLYKLFLLHYIIILMIHIIDYFGVIYCRLMYHKLDI